MSTAVESIGTILHIGPSSPEAIANARLEAYDRGELNLNGGELREIAHTLSESPWQVLSTHPESKHPLRDALTMGAKDIAIKSGWVAIAAAGIIALNHL